MPAPGLKKDNLESIYKDNSLLNLNYDFFGFSFWMMNRSEELFLDKKNKDIHNRFKVESSHAFKYNYLSRPIIDEWFLYFTELVRFVYPNITLNKFKFRIIPTHDIDNPRKFSLLSKKRILKNTILYFFYNRKSLFKNLLKFTANFRYEDPYNTFSWIFGISKKYNLKNDFYFMTDHANWRFDTGYNIRNHEIISLIKEIKKRGHNIGLHPSYNSDNNKKLFLKEALILKTILKELKISQNILGGRMHYLKFNNPNTAINWIDSNYQYDSSLGYSNLPGFRCGTCKEFILFDILNNQILNLTERPLIFMDIALFDSIYLDTKDIKKLKEYIDDLKKKCFDVNGDFLFLWHNCQLDTEFKKEMYEYLVSPIK